MNINLIQTSLSRMKESLNKHEEEFEIKVGRSFLVQVFLFSYSRIYARKN